MNAIRHVYDYQYVFQAGTDSALAGIQMGIPRNETVMSSMVGSSLSDSVNGSCRNKAKMIGPSLTILCSRGCRKSRQPLMRSHLVPW